MRGSRRNESNEGDGSDLNQTVDDEEAVATALQALEDGLYRAKEITCSMADLTHSGQPRGSRILSGFACLAILPPQIAVGHHSSLRRKALRPFLDGEKIGGPTHRDEAFGMDNGHLTIAVSSGFRLSFVV